MDVGAPAVVAAIHDAVGVWIHELPATPERILAALAARDGGEGEAAPGPTTSEAEVESAVEAPIAAGPDPRPAGARTIDVEMKVDEACMELS